MNIFILEILTTDNKERKENKIIKEVVNVIYSYGQL